MLTRASRRGVCLGIAVLGVAAAGMGCGGDSPTQPAEVPGGGVSPVRAGAPPDAPLPLGLQLAIVRQATAAFQDVGAAHAAGYTTENEPCVASPAGVMGVHAPNRELIGDPALDPARPELLLYVPEGGGYRLVGVEYLQIVLLRNPATNVVAPWVSEDPWPEDYTIVSPTPHLFGRAFRGPMPGHTPTMPWHWDLHVWAWADNPSGTFAEWNPALRCD